MLHSERKPGRHEKKQYNVWRVLGPAGPVETFSVYGIQAAAEAIYGTWDFEVTDPAGNNVPTHLLYAHCRKMGTSTCGD